MIDPKELYEQTVDGATDTTYPVPEAGEYEATIEEIAFRSFTTREDEERTVCDVSWHLKGDDALAFEEEVGMPAVVRQTIWLDMTADGKSLDQGKYKNRQLGKLREAVGQNVPGESWTFSKLIDQTAYVVVDHRLDQKTDDTYAEIKKVAPF